MLWTGTENLDSIEIRGERYWGRQYQVADAAFLSGQPYALKYQTAHFRKFDVANKYLTKYFADRNFGARR